MFKPGDSIRYTPKQTCYTVFAFIELPKVGTFVGYQDKTSKALYFRDINQFDKFEHLNSAPETFQLPAPGRAKIKLGDFWIDCQWHLNSQRITLL